MRYIFLLARIALVVGCVVAASLARGETLDRIEVQRHGKAAEIVIHFTTQVQYLRHAPRDSGKVLSVYLQLTGIGTGPSDLNDLVLSTRHSPPTDMVPPFTVTYPGTNGSILIEFDTPTRFSVRPGQDGRSLSVIVPILPGAQDWAAETKGSMPSPVAAAPAPTAAGISSPAPAPPAPSAAPAATQSAPPQPVVAVAAPARTVQAIQLVDVQRRGKEAEIRIQFAAPIQYARHAPFDSGNLLRIYARPSADTAPGAAQTLRLPETDMVPRFTVSYPDADNSVAIAFDQPTRFTVRQGADRQSISVVVPVLANAQDWSVQIVGPTVMAAVPASPPPALPPGATAQAGQAVAMPQRPVPAPSPPPTAVVSSTPPAAALMPQNMPVTAPLSKEEIESRAKEWIDAARQMIAVRNGVLAAARLNQVLSLPPNSQTEAANALMGEAREYSGELRKAAAEYESYLKDYPKGEFVPRVKERLAALNKTITQATAPSGTGLRPGTGPAEWSVSGGFSQYYYTGNSTIQTTTPPPPGQVLFSQSTLSLTDQKTLISSLDFSARKRDGATDTRIVLRDTDNRNYLQGQPSYDRLYSAYVEQTNKDVGYLVRAGRQLGTGGGILGRFDGLWVGYNLNPSWRINGVVGSPADFGDPYRRSVYGTSLDYAPQLGKPGFNVYYVEQTLEGVKDRQAIGSEIRYFDQNLNIFSLVDYDINFNQINIGLMQANLRTASGTNYYANVDIRRTPPLSLTTALPGQISQDPFNPTLSFRTLFQTSMSNLGIDVLRDQASILTGISSFYTAGFVRPVTPRWQLGASYSQANVTGTGASGILPAQPGTGTSHIFTGQALGSGMWRSSDSLVLSASGIFAPTYTGQNYNISYIVPINDWRFDALLGYYYQTDIMSQRQTRLSPTARVVYRLKKRMTLELDAGNEIFDLTGPLSVQQSRRTYLYGGYRWDFN